MRASDMDYLFLSAALVGINMFSLIMIFDYLSKRSPFNKVPEWIGFFIYLATFGVVHMGGFFIGLIYQIDFHLTYAMIAVVLAIPATIIILSNRRKLKNKDI